MPALEGQFLKEISVRFAGENHLRTQKTHKTKLCAEVPERPLPKDPFFQLLKVRLSSVTVRPPKVPNYGVARTSTSRREE